MLGLSLIVCIALAVVLSILGGWVFALWIWAIFIATVVSSYYVRVKRKPDAIIAMYVIYLALSQIIAAKIVALNILGFVFFVPAAVLIFPFTFQLTDMVNEYFGRWETHRMIFIAFATQVLMCFFLWMSCIMPPAPFWGEEAQAYWEKFFWQSIRITAASWISYLITENLDAILFAVIRRRTGVKHLWLRSVFSDVPMLALDSFIFVTLAFAPLPFLPSQFTWGQILLMIYGQIMTKWFSGVIDTPFIYLERYVVEGEFGWLRRLLQPLAAPFRVVRVKVKSS